MGKLSLQDNVWLEPRFMALCRTLGYCPSTTLGIITMMWGTTRRDGFDGGPPEVLKHMLPIEAQGRDALYAALLRYSYIVEDESGQAHVEGNRQHFATMASRKRAAKAGYAAKMASMARAPKAVVAAKPKPVRQRATALQRDAQLPILETCAQRANRACWEAYAQAYQRRWGYPPTRNAQVNACVKTFVQRVGAQDAPQVIVFFVNHPGRPYVEAMHPMKLAVRDAEGLRTQWLRGHAMTRKEVDEAERQQSVYNQLEQVGRGMLL